MSTLLKSNNTKTNTSKQPTNPKQNGQNVTNVPFKVKNISKWTVNKPTQTNNKLIDKHTKAPNNLNTTTKQPQPNQ